MIKVEPRILLGVWKWISLPECIEYVEIGWRQCLQLMHDFNFKSLSLTKFKKIFPEGLSDRPLWLRDSRSQSYFSVLLLQPRFRMYVTHFFAFFFLCFWECSGSVHWPRLVVLRDFWFYAEGSLLVILKGPNVVPGIKLRSAAYKANALTTVLSLQLLICFLV